MESKQEGNAEKVFKNFGQKVDQFLEELDDAGVRLKKEFEEKYQELKKSAEKLKEETKSKERWKEVEENLRKAGDELGNAFKSAFGKREK
jgi:cell division septum initiation protein DivIVA